ncbi:MAG: HTTM domain-containing protein [Fuerstiella sp.]
MTWLQLQTGWNLFFHAPESCSVLVLFRLTMGSLLTINALLLFPLITDFYATDGTWNLRAWKLNQGKRRLCLLHFLPDTTASFRLLLFVHLGSCLCFLAGWHYRISAVTVFLTLVSIHHRNASILSSGDTLLRIMAFLMMFSEAGAAFSIDAHLAGSVGFTATAPWPTRVMQIVLSTVYLRTVFWKLRGGMWRNGTAAWYPLWVDTFLRNRPPHWMLKPTMIRIATWGTLIEETALGTLIWIEDIRVAVLTFGIAMHIVFDSIMNLQLFSWIMIASLLLFLPPEVTDNFFNWL